MAEWSMVLERQMSLVRILIPPEKHGSKIIGTYGLEKRMNPDNRKIYRTKLFFIRSNPESIVFTASL